ncbi:hypothetical protein BG015_011435 [Linnemannia schmuckeri]|uniref:Uncharacterized protein n=1 Tax=Linnemannia schmuckeri TaxID=64567 RepID=A0A9P5RSK8_9FUNG|nr:hypothetical protein BG015_011435 [Linnemannia schmuckeri]
MMQVPDFADLVNKQAASYEFIADSLNVLNPALVKKFNDGKKKKKKRTMMKEALLFARKKGKNTLSGSSSGRGDSEDGDSEDDDDDPYGLSIHGEGGGDGDSGSKSGVWSRVWEYFAGTHDLEVASSENKLRQLYQGTMEDASNHVRDLILQVQDVLQSLDVMDQTLSNIHELTTKERKQQREAEVEVLSQLWAQLGGHRIKREMYKENLHLLQDMDSQRKATVGQIQSALWKLTDFEAEIGVLRERIMDAVVDGALQETASTATSDVADGMMASSDGDEVGGRGGGSPFEETVRAPSPPVTTSHKRISTVSLRAHIQQIDRVTSRLKERSFLAEAVIKAQADQIPSSMDGLSPPSLPVVAAGGVVAGDKAQS